MRAEDAPRGAVNGMLHALLLERMAEAGVRNQTAATVMAPQRDPYRMEKYRPQAEWVADSMQRISHRPVHVRGLHYAALDTTLPGGGKYENTEKAYEWMGDKPAKAARWLGLIPWTDVEDKKNADPVVYRHKPPDPAPQILLGGVQIQFPEDLAPEVDLRDFRAVQPFKLVIFAEKAAVGHVVLPLAERYEADAYLEGGEISDTHLFQMAQIGAEDGRPMRVLTLCDADPAGYWMPATIAWKLAALRDGWFPDLEFEVHPIGFLPEQVHAINEAGDPLPESPLKDGEPRAGAWEKTFGIQQVELDAIATLRPEILQRIVAQGIAPFYDRSLGRRVREARAAWQAAAQLMLEEQLGPDLIARLRADAEERLEGVQKQVDDLNAALWVDTEDVDLPPTPAMPTPNMNGTPLPFADPASEYMQFVRELKARGAYAKGPDSSNGKS